MQKKAALAEVPLCISLSQSSVSCIISCWQQCCWWGKWPLRTVAMHMSLSSETWHQVTFGDMVTRQASKWVTTCSGKDELLLPVLVPNEVLVHGNIIMVHLKKKKKRLFSWEKDKPVVVFPKQSSPGPLQHLGETESLLGCFTAAQHWTGAANPSAWTDCPCDSDPLAVVTSVLSPWQPQVWQMWQSCVLSANSLANPLLALVRKAYG